MSSDVVLTSALRSNLLSLQNTQRLIDDTQLRLATGLRVNSALDNPQNFFTAQSLNNRANDLSRLLDGIGQSIRTIETADNGVTALTSLIEQSQSVVTSARDALASSEGEARIVGDVDLSDVADITTGAFATAGIAAGDSFRISTTDANGLRIEQEIVISAGSAASLAAQITNAFADNENGEITAEITSEGFLAIQSNNGQAFRIVDGDTAGPGANPITLAGFQALGLGDVFDDETRNGATLASATIVSGSTASSISLFEGTGDVAEAGDQIIGTSYTDVNGSGILNLSAGSTITLTVTRVDGSTDTTAATNATSTFQDLVDLINQDTLINQEISADFSANGQLSFTSLSDQVASISLNVTTGGATDDFAIGLGDSTGVLDPINDNTAGLQETIIRFNNSTEALDALANDYNTLRDQIDTLVADAQFRGVNLLNGDSLTTFFNENNTSSLITEGATFTADGLNITEASFRSSTEIELSATQAREALEAVRAFGSSLANNLSIIQTRRDFTEQTVSTLSSGADDLTVADQNEEGANLLALQTRQSLGVTSLSLASQSQQSVLRLF